MYRLAIYFGASEPDAAALQDEVAALMRRRARAAPLLETAGYVVTLASLPEPPDDEAFVALVSADGERILLGPPELLEASRGS